MSIALQTLCAGIDPGDQEALEGLLLTRELTEGEVLIAEGLPQEGLWVVESGELRVTIEDIELARVGPSAWVGEVGLLDPGPASATVTAQQPTVVKLIAPALLEGLMADQPEVARPLVRALSVSLARRLRATAGAALSGQGNSDAVGHQPAARGWLARLAHAVLGDDT